MFKNTLLGLFVSIVVSTNWLRANEFEFPQGQGQTQSGQLVYVTSTGARFEVVKDQKFKRAWMTPGKVVWSGRISGVRADVKRQITNLAMAEEDCKKLGGNARLPSVKDYRELLSYFHLDPYYGTLSERGRVDFLTIFPEQTVKDSITSTLVASADGKEEAVSTFAVSTLEGIENGFRHFGTSHLLSQGPLVVRCVRD